jgi:hypothetical protein
MIMKKRYLIIFLILSLFQAQAQDVPLFKSKETLHIRATGSIKSIKKKSNDSTFVTGKFQYRQDTSWITVPVQTRVRGNFRLKNCFFPPLKVKFNKKDVASTLFAGNKSLKLVLPCQTSYEKDGLIRREYLCYQFYALFTPYFFRTRLAEFELSEITKKNPRSFLLLSFFVEDNSMVAKRNHAEVIDTKGINPGRFDMKHSVRNDFFQYMIGNADWSAVYQHNSNVLLAEGKYIPLSYDFDMSGFVDASYAHANAPTLGTGNPRERVYRGFCKPESVMEEVRKEFLERESAVHALIDEHATYFDKSEVKDMHGYINEFFEILKSDNRFKYSIVNQCRTR